MTFKNWIALTLLTAATARGDVVLAQGSADDQAAVWARVEAIWIATEDGDDDWIDDMLSADFVAWPNNSPAPRNKTSTRLWHKFDTGEVDGLTHELYPLSIVVHGDTAIAHYLYTNAVRTRDKKTQVTNGRYTDVLVRENGEWKFISWHGGSDP